MKWNIKEKPIYKLGDIRTVIKFAFLPLRVNKAIIWLEKYKSHQELKSVYAYSIGCSCVEPCYCESTPTYEEKFIETDRSLI